MNPILLTMSLCKGGPHLLAPSEIGPFSPSSLNYFLDAPQNNFLCSLNQIWFLPAPSTIVNLLPAVELIQKCITGRCLCETFLEH